MGSNKFVKSQQNLTKYKTSKPQVKFDHSLKN